MTQFAKGTLAMVLACLAWGLSPVYYALFQAISPAEILAHRTLWSVVTFVTLLVLTGRTGHALQVVKQPKTMGLILLAGVFIFSVSVGRVTESSLGYYIFPLVMVLLGFMAFRETLTALQWVAIALACVAVLVLTIGLGAAPWLALMISFSFGIYGLLKRIIKVDSVVSVTLEVVLLLPFALAYLYAFADLPDTKTLLALMFSGLITAGPLVLMTYATQRVPMATVGLVQYLNPILQYFCAIVILGEVITGWHVIAIALIWIALVFYWLAVFRAERKTVSISSTV
jgi:chloramphenicol-sensitive protein RarD